MYTDGFDRIDFIYPSTFTNWQQRRLGVEGAQEDVVAPIILENNNLYFIPININNNHWVLGFINNQNRTVGVLDSLGATRDTSSLRLLLVENNIDPDLYRDTDMGTGPRQENTYDCGFWVIANALGILTNGRPAPSQSTGSLRLGILQDILRGVRAYRPDMDSRRLQWREQNRNQRRAQLSNNLTYAISMWPQKFTTKTVGSLKDTIKNDRTLINLVDADEAFKKAMAAVPAFKNSQFFKDPTSFSTVPPLQDIQRQFDRETANRLGLSEIENTPNPRVDQAIPTDVLSNLISHSIRGRDITPIINNPTPPTSVKSGGSRSGSRTPRQPSIASSSSDIDFDSIIRGGPLSGPPSRAPSRVPSEQPEGLDSASRGRGGGSGTAPRGRRGATPWKRNN